MTDIFTIQDFHFPEGFLWGSATAAIRSRVIIFTPTIGRKSRNGWRRIPLLKFQAPPVIIIRCTKRIYSFCLILTTAPIAWESSGRALSPKRVFFCRMSWSIMSKSFPCSRKGAFKPLSRSFTYPCPSGLLKKGLFRPWTICRILSGIYNMCCRLSVPMLIFGTS